MAADNKAQKLPVTVLTGFLGAGKTTLLNSVLTGDHGLRIAVLVNDFGDINIDAELVVGVEEDMVSLANGCVCCQVRDDLVDSITSLLARTDRPDHVILEASGVAEPMSLAMTFTQEQFQADLRLDGIISVVDTEQFLDQPELMEHKLRQVVCADLVVLNKIDLVEEEQVCAVRSWIDGRVNRIRFVPAVQADVPLEVLLGIERRPSESADFGVAGLHDHGDRFKTFSYVSASPLDVDALLAAVKLMPGTLYRMKGIIATTESPDKRGVLQVAGRRTSVVPGEPWGSDPAETRIVAIGSPDLPIEEITEAIDGCLVL